MMEIIPIRNPFAGAVTYLTSTTESTQRDARRLAEARNLPGARFPPGSVIAAEAQTAGRGRVPGRKWQSEAGKNLLFTVFLDAGSASLPGLPIRIGGALCSAASLYAEKTGSSFAGQPKLKWPNDLMLGDRKAAGILCEAGPSGVFAGIGLNCNQVAFPPELELKATSLAIELGREVDRRVLLELFLEALADSLVDRKWRRKADERLWKRGESAIFIPGAAGSGRGRGAIVGTPEGVDEAGSLLFKEKGATEAIAYAAGEFRAGKQVDRGPSAL